MNIDNLDPSRPEASYSQKNLASLPARLINLYTYVRVSEMQYLSGLVAYSKQHMYTMTNNRPAKMHIQLQKAMSQYIYTIIVYVYITSNINHLYRLIILYQMYSMNQILLFMHCHQSICLAQILLHYQFWTIILHFAYKPTYVYILYIYQMKCIDIYKYVKNIKKRL